MPGITATQRAILEAAARHPDRSPLRPPAPAPRGAVARATLKAGPRARHPRPGEVSELRGSGGFATRRAARATGDHDLNVLFLRLAPVRPVQGIGPGATVLLHPGRGTP
jgi:hypothetical protein